MRLIKFGSYTPPAPTEYDVDIQDIDSADTGRGETGFMSRERVRAGIYKISVSFTNISSDDVLKIKKSISSEKVKVEFFDGETVSADMYAGDRKLKLKSIDDVSNCIWDMSFSMTEF